MANLRNFIKDYFSLLNLSKMPEAVKKHYDKLVKNDDFPNKTVKKWKDSWNADNKWDTQNLPKFDTLSDDDLVSLYTDLLETFATMSSHSGTLNSDTKDLLLDKYYGQGKLFNTPPIPYTEKQQIQKLLVLLFNDTDVMGMDLLGYEDTDLLRAALNDQKKLENADVKKSIYNVIRRIKQYKIQGYLSEEADKKLSTLGLDNIQNAVNPYFEPTPNDIAKLKTDAPEIFKILFNKKKAYEDFKKYEPGEKIVSEQIDKALYDTDYTGKINEENYIAPTYNDDLNWRQKLEKKLEDTYSDVLKKYLTLHRANLTITKTAPAIIKQFDKAKIKPTDGINAILEKSNDISNKLKGKEPFDAADHFKWMADKLMLYKNNGMGKAIEAALHNRRQIDHIIEQMIFDAVEEGKIAQAKTAMEVLSIMQYGMFTSRRMEAINKTDMTILSDKGLSWNKNEGIQFVTSAMDKTLKTGIQLAGYTATAVANKVFRRPSRVLDKSEKLEKAVIKKKSDINTEKTNFLNDKQNQDALDTAEIQRNEQRITASGIVDDADLTNKKSQLKNDRNVEEQKRGLFESAEQNFAQWEQYKKDYEQQKIRNDGLEHNINEYEDAKDLKAITEKQMAERQKKSDKWDEEHKNDYVELWAHWEFLQSGKTKSLFHLSTKKLQDKMDGGKMKNRYNDFYAQWLKSHPYAA